MTATVWHIADPLPRPADAPRIAGGANERADYITAKHQVFDVITHLPKLVLEPIFEADFEDNAYGYRPARGAADAVGRFELLYNPPHPLSAPITVSAVRPWRTALQREVCLPF
jgi:hypothetical protein